jgi:hypothetical protein
LENLQIAMFLHKKAANFYTPANTARALLYLHFYKRIFYLAPGIKPLVYRAAQHNIYVILFSPPPPLPAVGGCGPENFISLLPRAICVEYGVLSLECREAAFIALLFLTFDFHGNALWTTCLQWAPSQQ